MKSRKSLHVHLVAALIGAATLTTQAAVLIDDFSGNLSAYTATRILNNGNHNPTNTYSWGTTGGSLAITTTAYVGIEQFALTRTDRPLTIGEELQVDYDATNLGSQDIGLYIGSATPTVDVRSNYLNVYVRNNSEIYSRGFNGTTEVSLAAGGLQANIDQLFIAKTGANNYELGYYVGTTRNVLISRTGVTGVDGSVIGFYADVRAAGTRGNLDNLTVIPEPSAALLGGLGALGLLRRRRA